MVKKTITWTDFNGTERTEDFYFHLSEAELAEMEMSNSGGLKATIEAIVATQDTKALVEIFKDLLLKSYGEKSLDGREFTKSEEITKRFTATEAYSKLFMELAFDDIKAAEFTQGLITKVPKQNSAPSITPLQQ